jgi:hypothetical protein
MPSIAIRKDGKKFLWDKGKYLLYTRRVVTEIV